MRPVTLALTHYNRYPLLLQAVEQVIEDSRISEVVIMDDSSTDGSFKKIQSTLGEHSKVRLFQTIRNLDCYRNKREAVNESKGDWVILFDSDNVLTPSYLDALERAGPWNQGVFYLPVFARPHFDYRAFSGLTISRENVASFMDKPHFACALNTANYLVPRWGYLWVWDDKVDPHTADSIYMAYNWLKEGGKLHFVPGLHYEHRIHKDSHYKLNVHKTGNFAAIVEKKLREMR